MGGSMKEAGKAAFSFRNILLKTSCEISLGVASINYI